MAICFLNNVYCCYLPAHCSHGLQPLDNGVFNAVKTAYRKELGKLASLTDSAPVDKVNFIQAYAKARKIGITSKNILSGWRITGNWPISRTKALRHPEIQADRVEVSPDPIPYLGSDDTPKTGRQIRDLGKNKSPSTRRRYTVIAKGFEAQEQTLVEHTARIASLEEEVSRLKRGKKRKAIPNPNRRFMSLSEALATGKELSTIVDSNLLEEEVLEVESEIESEVESEMETASAIEVQSTTTRSGRLIKRPRYL
jgi:hypothetical protein